MAAETAALRRHWWSDTFVDQWSDVRSMSVVRLSDGASWLIADQWPIFKPASPVGLTCEEVFILGEYGGRYNIARFRLDSLGPPIPPD
jgi:hypothetical protein